MNAEIRYLYHSGFSIKTDKHFCIFDYYLNTPQSGSLDEGVINPEEIKDLDVVVFVSHNHSDHYNPVIFDWRKTINNIRYVLSDDIITEEEVLFVSPRQEYSLNGLSISTLESTDAGVAFLIKVDGLCIFHAGDLNDWYWNGEPDEDNLEMTRRYKEQIDTLKGEIIDLAFIPVDPRLEENYLLGLDYFMKTVSAECVIPMHFGDDTSIIAELNTDVRADDYRDKIVFLSNRGARFIYHKDTND